MIDRDKIVCYLNELLNTTEFDDYCVNGLQVEGKKNIKKVVFGVSASLRLFQQAVEKNADMILVHHGVFWKSDPSPFALTGIFRERLALLLKKDINLLAYHLPLDAHPEFGNNAQILKLLNITPIKPIDVGFLGELNSKLNSEEFLKIVNQKLNTESQFFPFGAPDVHRIMVMSGGSSHYYKLAIENNADTFIGGEIKENVVRQLEEVGLNYINAGHYNTEKFGVQALRSVLAEKFNLSCEFIDVPNPV